MIDNKQNGIYFHDLKAFEVKFKSKHKAGRINDLRNNFYLFDPSLNIYCYNFQKRVLIEKICVERFDNFIKNSNDGYICCFNGNLIRTSYNSKSIIKPNRYLSINRQ